MESWRRQGLCPGPLSNGAGAGSQDFPGTVRSLERSWVLAPAKFVFRRDLVWFLF